ncbi:MAG: hypothetical protein GY773_32250 [Actinomycetia bacterium]|nr:hypothetical protein [Actinomycetes bacterium]
MDEPLSNLDAKLRVQMRAEIAALQRDLGVTTIYVTHDQVEAMTMGDRVAVLKRGILQQVATPQELYDTPRNVFVAGFIGSPSMNLMKVRLVGSGSDLRLQLGSRELAFGQAVIDARPALADYVDGEVVVGIRPEDIEDASLESDAPEGQILHTETTLVESLGAEVILHFLLDAEPYAIMDAEFEGEDAVVATPDDDGRFTYVARVSPRSAAKIGDPIDLVVDTGRLHFFDPGTGLAITG